MNHIVWATLVGISIILTPAPDLSHMDKPKPPDKLDVWLDKLAKAENCPTSGLIDSNNKKSYGEFCFQEATFRTYVERYKLLPNAEPQEILNFLYDSDFQRYLARRMIEEDIKNADHWRNSVKKIGQPPKNAQESK